VRRVVWPAVALLVLLSGCASAEEYQAAQAAWEARNAQGPSNCPATRRSNGTCISDGGP
jgi:predicted component of type VI protein secretion system